MSAKPFRYPLWVRGDLDGFFGLMVDNLVQVLLIIDLCKYVAGLPDDLIYQRILPGVAVSLLIGNVFYGLQAQWVARRHGNATCTALPYGINTPSVIAYVIFIMGPVYRMTGDGHMAWMAGLMACLVSGIVEFLGAFFAERLRRITPRAALLGVLAAIGITFIAADFALRIYTRPLVGLLPLAFLLLAYFARFKFPWRLPGGFLAILFGTLIAWGTTLAGADWFGGVAMSATDLRNSLGANFENVKFITPVFVGGELWTLLTTNQSLLLLYLTVSVPMGIINVLGSLQNIESAEAGGDRFATGPSLTVNGIGTIAAGLFGSCFPTTIYIGHPGWKALGARSSYSILNESVFHWRVSVWPWAVSAGADSDRSRRGDSAVHRHYHHRAGLPGDATRARAGRSDFALPRDGRDHPGYARAIYFDYPRRRCIVDGDCAASQRRKRCTCPACWRLTGANSGWIVVTLILTAIGAALIDHKYRAAAVWAAAATVLTVLGAMHAYRLEYRNGENVVREYFIWQNADCVHLQNAPVHRAGNEPARGGGLPRLSHRRRIRISYRSVWLGGHEAPGRA